jgi:hypothetical protein
MDSVLLLLGTNYVYLAKRPPPDKADGGRKEVAA